MISIDLNKGIVNVDDDGQERSYELSSPEAFNLISKVWLRAGWDAKYVYTFTWMGRPIIQLPDDLIRVQEVIYQVKPDVIIETGVAHGGSLIFYASLCKAMGRGRVIGIDIEIRPHNRVAIENHELSGWISLIEGDSTDLQIVDQVRKLIQPDETVFAMLDSNHTKAHVLEELNAYSSFVSLDSYIVVADGIMGSLVGAPRSHVDWDWNNPISAIDEFVRTNQDFVVEPIHFPFNEGTVSEPVTYWPKGFLKRIR